MDLYQVFPIPIIQEIFILVGFPKILVCRIVCKKWREIVPSIPMGLNFSCDGFGEYNFEKVFRLFNNVRSLSITERYLQIYLLPRTLKSLSIIGKSKLTSM